MIVVCDASNIQKVVLKVNMELTLKGNQPIISNFSGEVNYYSGHIDSKQVEECLDHFWNTHS